MEPEKISPGLDEITIEELFGLIRERGSSERLVLLMILALEEFGPLSEEELVIKTNIFLNLDDMWERGLILVDGNKVLLSDDGKEFFNVCKEE